ncbi:MULTISPECIES: type I-G CRISPR-associated helicase/endonuclease Cas3g [unclassified Halorhodospira]|uniref:type I-G CRISPR-associated helicase/endonuclease Cas3g n=1 Tax=unclassified Halorhodospira TaxID=2626748 RepID=UPI001EE94B92|nr:MULTISPECIES: CRISPR-associated helicase Cas3' [unclassified Halorhodospira]MCG5540852.1 CRISPR-associated helicase Cas3' [Halorhodospira sp. M39old]MCG5546092.1 CRISPR-associated helicase Cas3' [Halorhodospira sp. M38]
MSYDTLFAAALGQARRPYPYQRRLAEGSWPECLEVPTGLGKTAAVTLAWAHRRGIRPDGLQEAPDPETPRRLVWCLPMRVLVEQTVQNIRNWLSRLGVLGDAGEPDRVAVHALMGGEADLRRGVWAAYPEQDAVLVGTQDMLLSRALMRGYGMSRYQWPVHHALLHNDALWVFDEVQLMGPALPTTAQLEAFRRDLDTAGPARSIWVSATLQAEWLDTVDFRRHRQDGVARLTLDDTDRSEPAVAARVGAPKALEAAATRLDDVTKKGQDAYVAALADEIRAAHHPGEQTLVIVNRVERAQGLYDALADADADRLLLHARFRPAERAAIEEQLHHAPQGGGRIVIATQAVEAGVDLDSRVLFTELAPWASLVQRFGRCNRAGRFADARVYWIDMDETAKGVALPYAPESLSRAREQLQAAPSAAPQDLPPVTEPPAAAQVLRRRDLLELFNTDPDLSGFDVDVSPYIRDTGTPQVHLFWRDVDREGAAQQPAPERAELCPASVTQVQEHLMKKLPAARKKAVHREAPAAWRFDPLAGEHQHGGWTPVRRAEEVRPGQTLMLAAGDGGYDPHRGFVAGAAAPVDVIAEAAGSQADEGYGDDRLTATGQAVALADHLDHVAAAARELADALALDEAERALLETAAYWHDVGKAHEAFQRGIGATPDDPDGPWAKSTGGGRPDYHRLDPEGRREPRPGLRHELASALAWLEHGAPERSAAERDLIAYLIAAHHGRVRLGLRALPNEPEPPDAADTGRLYARGVWHGDRLPALQAGPESLPATELRLDLMRLGRGPQGPSWSERTRRLLEAHGPFRLAWLEALLRIADWRASAREGEA